MAVISSTCGAVAACGLAILVVGCRPGVSGPTPSATLQTPGPPAATARPNAATPVEASASATAALSGRLTFDRFDGGPGGHFIGTFVADAGGSDATRLPLPYETDGGAAWSPDGRQLLVTVCAPPACSHRVAVLNADGTGFHYLPISRPTGLGCWAWSPDGRSLLCGLGGDPAKGAGIYSIHVDGSGLKRLTKSPIRQVDYPGGESCGGDSFAAFSPDGSRFVFMREQCDPAATDDTSATGALMIADADGSRVTELVPQGGVFPHDASILSWSPDGQEIAFTTGDIKLATIRPDGSGLHEIDIAGQDFGWAYGPAWSPDGSRIAFSSLNQYWVGDALYVVAPDGSGLAKLGAATAGAANLRWGPAASP